MKINEVLHCGLRLMKPNEFPHSELRLMKTNEVLHCGLRFMNTNYSINNRGNCEPIKCVNGYLLHEYL